MTAPTLAPVRTQPRNPDAAEEQRFAPSVRRHLARAANDRAPVRGVA